MKRNCPSNLLTGYDTFGIKKQFWFILCRIVLPNHTGEILSMNNLFDVIPQQLNCIKVQTLTRPLQNLCFLKTGCCINKRSKLMGWHSAFSLPCVCAAHALHAGKHGCRWQRINDFPVTLGCFSSIRKACTCCAFLQKSPTASLTNVINAYDVSDVNMLLFVQFALCVYYTLPFVFLRFFFI